MNRIVQLGCVALLLNACSSDSTTTTSTSDAGSSVSDSGSTGDSGTTATALNGCSTYTDKTAGGATITWDQTSAVPPATCIHIKKGGTVTFNGSFANHPLLPKGGDAPTPFSTAPSGTTATITFASTGTFGFVCGVHSTMTGAIQVTE